MAEPAHDPHAGESMVGPHGAADDHGDAHGHDDHAHGGEALGPIDVRPGARPCSGSARPGRGARVHPRPPLMSAPIILVPGFWLGAWAWDEVAGLAPRRRPRRHRADAARPRVGRRRPLDVTFADHVDAIVDAVEAAASPVVLAVHSATGFSGYAASDRVPDRIAAMVYVDTAPGQGRPRPRASTTSRSRWSGRTSRRRRTSTA